MLGSEASSLRPDWKARGWEEMVVPLLAGEAKESGIPTVTELLLPNVAASCLRGGCRMPAAAASGLLGRLASGPRRCCDSSPEVGVTPSATGPALVWFEDCVRCKSSSE